VSSLRVLRLLRVFRSLKLLRQVEGLNKIVNIVLKVSSGVLAYHPALGDVMSLSTRQTIPYILKNILTQKCLGISIRCFYCGEVFQSYSCLLMPQTLCVTYSNFVLVAP
jgi:hypothetical protein